MPDEGEDGIPPFGVKAGGRLVQNHDLGAHGHDAGHRRTPLFAARQIKGGLFQQRVGQLDQPGRLAHPTVDLLLVQPHVFGAEGDIFVDRIVKELVFRILKNQPHPEPHGADLLGIGPDVLPIEQDSARSGAKQAIEVLHQGRLARAGMTDDPDALPLFDAQADIRDGVLAKGGIFPINIIELFGCYD